MLDEVSRQKYPFSLPDLPYAYDALEPHLDQKTLQLHHREHHATYVKKLNEAVAKETGLQQMTLEQLLSARHAVWVRSATTSNASPSLMRTFSFMCHPAKRCPNATRTS